MNQRLEIQVRLRNTSGFDRMLELTTEGDKNSDMDVARALRKMATWVETESRSVLPAIADMEQQLLVELAKVSTCKLITLKYVLGIVSNRNYLQRTPGYLAACDEIKTIIEASIERLEAGESMEATASTEPV